ncbi:helix-turn-helix transcriptional regulator [Streptomyces litchfieldiae]|uniref:LuxR C-terminal-related transcriptional regulator n=1 Tax=Streptomyces litchfieldiae TaxID=3075543 RepID=A0ABU2N0Q3_9ACTN|nr:LuxR C-terminal-related transcriptional regulator [Streptomyces sp. DSM 44938]MDT0347326.1 LuxR C-terminal-related transcriptional regulator [Streptomyces sp. DSM 44938]
MLLMTYLEHPTPANPALHAELLRSPHCHRITLGPLTASGVGELLAADMDVARADQLALDWHAFTGGNPLLIRAFRQEARSVAGDGRPPAGPVAGGVFTEVALACLHRGGPVALDVARGIAVLGHDVTPELLARLLATDLTELNRTVQILNAGGFLEAMQFRHPAVRTAVLKDPAFEALPEWHYRAAELLEAEGVPPVRVAEHLVAANRASTPWSIAVLLETSGESLRRNDVGFALRCLELAHRECPPGPERTELIGMLIRAEWQTSPARANTYLAELMDTWRQHGLPDREALTVVKAQLWYGRIADAIEVLKGTGESLVDGDSATDLASMRNWVRASYPELFYGIQNFFESRLAHATDAAVINDANPPGRPLTAALSSEGDGAFVRHAEDVLQNYRMGDWWLAPPSAAILDLVYADQLKRAERWCSRLLQEAEARGVRSWRGIIFAIRGEMARRNGQILQAEENSRAALDQVSPRSWGVMVGLPLANLVVAATAKGEYEEADIYLERSVPEAMFQTRYGLHYLEAQGHYNLATGRHQAALRYFLICGRRMREWDLDVPILVPWRTGAAEALVRLGDKTGARQHLDEQLERPTGYHPRIRGAALRVRAATAEPRQRLSLLREATSLQRNWQNEFELLRALADLSNAYQNLGEQHHARTAARRAWRLAERCRAEPLARKLLPAYGAAYSTSQPPDPQLEGGSDSVLSAAELRVAELASLGHTNRQIAGKLYITVSTVEQHLTRVYRKLNVSRRVDLPARLGMRESGV